MEGKREGGRKGGWKGRDGGREGGRARKEEGTEGWMDMARIRGYLVGANEWREGTSMGGKEEGEEGWRERRRGGSTKESMNR